MRLSIARRLRWALAGCSAEGRLLALADALKAEIEADAAGARLLADARFNDALAARMADACDALLAILPRPPATVERLDFGPSPLMRGDRVVVQPPGLDDDGLPLAQFVARVARIDADAVLVEPDGATVCRAVPAAAVIRNLDVWTEGAMP